MKRVILILAIIIGSYILYMIFKTQVTHQADLIANEVITSTVTDNIIYNLDKNRKLKEMIKLSNNQAAIKELDELINVQLFMLEECKLKKCKNAIARHSN